MNLKFHSKKYGMLLFLDIIKPACNVVFKELKFHAHNCSLLLTILIMLISTGVDKIVANNPQLRSSSCHGSQAYEQWVVQLQNDILVSNIIDKAVKRKLVACTDHLKVSAIRQIFLWVLMLLFNVNGLQIHPVFSYTV